MDAPCVGPGAARGPPPAGAPLGAGGGGVGQAAPKQPEDFNRTNKT